MNNFWSLVKINLSQMFVTSITFENNDSPKKRWVFGAILAFAVVYMAGGLAFLSYQIGFELKSVGMEKLLIIMSFFMASFMVFIQVFFSCFSFIFKAKDYELLSSLPIKNSVVIMSKLVSFLIFCYSLSFIFFLPMTVFYFIFAGFNFLVFLYVVLGFLCLPFFPMFIGILFSFLVNLLTHKFRFKNLFNIILLVGIFAGIMVLSFRMQDIIFSLMTNSQASFETFTNIYFPLIFVGKAISTGDFLNFLLYVGISILPLLLLILVIAKKYKFFNSYFSQSVRGKFVKFKSKQKGLLPTLLTKEITRVFSSPMVMLNCCAGPLILVVYAISALTGALDTFGMTEGFSVTVLIIALTNLMMSMTATSFSLEGDRFWLLKNLPISVKQIIFSKILCMFVLFLVPNIVGATILSIYFKFSLLQNLLIFAIMFASILLSSLIGIAIDLKKCNIHWKNEIAMVKQSVNVLINLLFGFLLGLSPFIIYFYLFPMLSSLIFSGIVTALYLLIAFGILIYLKKNAKVLFEKIR